MAKIRLNANDTGGQFYFFIDNNTNLGLSLVNLCCGNIMVLIEYLIGIFEGRNFQFKQKNKLKQNKMFSIFWEGELKLEY